MRARPKTRGRASRSFAANGIVTLTTDFGTRDGYVGAVKGVLLGADRELALHDLAHDLPAQDVAHGARVLRAACPFFPRGTVHLAVVDPGVGGARAPIAALAGGHAFVGPDNGLFSLVAAALGGFEGAWQIERRGALEALLPRRPAPTFHGRDLFGPTAAALASGAVAPADVGPSIVPVALPAPPAPRRDRSGRIAGEVTHFDRFGNAVTSLTAADVAQLGAGARVALRRGGALPLRATYAAVAPGAPLALVGSEGFVEIAVRDGSARDHFRLTLGVAVTAAPARRSASPRAPAPSSRRR